MQFFFPYDNAGKKQQNHEPEDKDQIFEPYARRDHWIRNKGIDHHH